MLRLISPYLVAAVIVGTIILGVRKQQYANGQRDLLATIEKARVASIAEKTRIDDEISQLDDDELLLRALRYVRTSPR